MQRITAVGAALDGLEQLAAARSTSDDGPFSWPLHRGRVAQVLGPVAAGFLDPVFRHPQWLAVPLVRVLAASGLLVGRPRAEARAAMSAVLCATAAAKAVRNRFGGDGSDHMSFITLAASAVAEAFPDDPWIRQHCIRFVALQSLLSYATSGAVKVVSPVWRSGAAVTGVFRTQSYGDQDFHRWVARYPVLRMALSWAVIVGELCFPLVYFASPAMTRVLLAAGVAFHVANGRFMGLNRFLWAFVGTYPGVAHLAAARRPAVTGAAA